MINDLKLGFRVLKYGLNFKSSMVGIILFMILGCGMELFVPEMPIGGLYLAIGAIFAAQLIHSVCQSTMVQTSPYKKKLQTGIPAGMVLLLYMAVNTVLLAIRFWAYDFQGKSETQLSNMILFCACMMVVITLYTSAAFKAFWLATIIFLIFFMGLYPGLSILMMRDEINGEPLGMILPLWASVLVSYLLIAVSCAVMYLIFLALYKKEYSKMTFQAALNRAK